MTILHQTSSDATPLDVPSRFQQFHTSSKQSPCPICGRTKDSDCRWKNNLFFCHTYINQDAGVDGYTYKGVSKNPIWGVYALKTSQDKNIRARGTKDFFYPDRNGQPLVKITRIDRGDGSKKFFQSHWTGAAWCKSVPKSVRRSIPIYRYLEVKQAIAEQLPIIVTEGEGCADRLWSLGIPATTTIGGCQGYRRYGDYSKDLAEAQLVLCPDRDLPGIQYMEEIARDFPSVKWLYPFPNSPLWKTQLPPKGGLDIADWIDEGAKREEILAAIGPEIHKSVALRGNQGLTDSEAAQNSVNELRLTLPYEELIERIGEILEIDDEGRQEWEGGLLARTIPGFSWHQLKSIYQKFADHQTDFKPMDVLDFLESGPKERKWLISGLISAATTLLVFADGGVGKTLLAMDLVKAVASGVPWNGFHVRQGKVLVVQTDEPEIDTRERLKIAGFNEISAGTVHIETNWQFTQIGKFENWIEAEKPAFVIIDSLTSANRNAASGSEWDVSYAASLYKLRDIANNYGCSILILHHENKAGGARGTTAIRNNVSEVWRLRKGKEKENLKPTQRVLEIEKSRSGCTGVFKLELNVEDFSWEYQGDFGETAGTQAGFPELLSYLNARPGVEFEPEKLTLEFPGISKDAIRKQLERLCRRGLVNSEERVKPHRTGASRYKVYFVPDLNNTGERVESLDGASSVAETFSKPSVQTLDAQNSSDFDVQRPETLLNHGLDHAGQGNEVEQQTQNLQHQDLRNSQDSSIQCGDRVYYRGSSGSLRNLCGEKALDVLNIEEGVAECTFSTWVVTQKLPINDLQKIST